jgi:Holliday junction resolvasome RuvABC endonuclease subunit
MIILGIDPGERTGFCLFDADKKEIIESGVIDGNDLVRINQLVDSHMPDVIIVEDQFLGSKKNKNGENRYFIHTYAKLKFYTMTWERIAKYKNIHFEKPVNPSTWQAYWKLKKGDKEGMCNLVNKLVGKEAEQDEADAFLIACWAAANIQGKEIIKQAERKVKR